ncbi:hypothetical protein D018_2232B, partial [Vibrio parahaemolyticus VP2007-007]
GQIHHMDVITHASAVRGWVVATEYREFFSATNSDLGDKWHQVIGNALWVFPHAARWVRANWVEVTQ